MEKPETGENTPLSREAMTYLIRSHFSTLSPDDLSSAVEQLRDVPSQDLNYILNSGRLLSGKSHRVILSYLKAASFVYRTFAQDAFREWNALLKKISSLSNSCIEGFFDASGVILQKGGMSILQTWAELGLSVASKDKGLAISYFTTTAEVVVSVDFEYLEELVSIGSKFSVSNIRASEAYFKNLSDLLSLLSRSEFHEFIDIIENMREKDWRTVVEIINSSRETFVSIEPERRHLLLNSLSSVLRFSVPLTLSLFNRSPLAMANLNDNDFSKWLSVIEIIAGLNADVAMSFVNRSPRLLGSVDIDEIEQWAEKGSALISRDRQAAKAFIEHSFKGLENHIKDTDREKRAFILDVGAELALVNPACVENYFKYAPDVLDLFNHQNFKEWLAIGKKIAEQSSNLGSGYCRHSAVAFKKIPQVYHGEVFATAHMLLEIDWLLAGVFFESLPEVVEKIEPEEIRIWAGTGLKVYEKDKKIAVDYFAFSPSLLEDLDIKELEAWALKGISIFEENSLRGRPYFSLKSKSSTDTVEELKGGVALKKVANILRYYALGLSGVNFSIRSKHVLPLATGIDFINPIIAGNVIYLEPKIKEYGSLEDNFNMYKLSVMHEVGHVQFSRKEISAKAAVQLFEKTGLKDITGTETNISETMDISGFFSAFPNHLLAVDIMGVIEDARIEYMIFATYGGLRDKFKNIRDQLLKARSVPENDLGKFMEALLWLSTGNEPVFVTDEKMKNAVSASRDILCKVLQPHSSILDSLEATFRIYSLLEGLFDPLEKQEYSQIRNLEYRGIGISALTEDEPASTDPYEHMLARFVPQCQESKQEDKKEEKPDEMFQDEDYAIPNNWNVLGSFRYDEWDTVINDYKSGWCVVKEIEPAGESGEYFDDAIIRYSNEIALIRRIFSTMKPESFHKLKGQTDGTEIDIDTFMESIIQKRCGANLDDRFYVRWDKRERDVATLFLVDVSASTSKKLSNEGQSIIDVEKDSVIIMSQALESLGDKYAIYAFSGHTRNDVEYYLIKEFDEELSDSVARRISSLEPVANTRLGPVIRHSIVKLEKVQARTKMIVLLSDGEPYDTCHGEGAYEGRLAEEDTRVAIQEGNARNIHFFCITVDKNPGNYLDTIFSNVGYTIIDNAQVLPARLPALYKRLTT
ncbi:MAG: nitric oxide reductase activation protein NorD [Methanomethylovorans sp.]|uniref:nitric oxide reductase activation protein NorD n=1 Tax=Methanomethylovorans sp. TaxID=2758717 RepID=UPI003530AF08